MLKLPLLKRGINEMVNNRFITKAQAAEWNSFYLPQIARFKSGQPTLEPEVLAAKFNNIINNKKV